MSLKFNFLMVFGVNGGPETDSQHRTSAHLTLARHLADWCMFMVCRHMVWRRGVPRGGATLPWHPPWAFFYVPGLGFHTHIYTPQSLEHSLVLQERCKCNQNRLSVRPFGHHSPWGKKGSRVLPWWPLTLIELVTTMPLKSWNSFPLKTLGVLT